MIRKYNLRTGIIILLVFTVQIFHPAWNQFICAQNPLKKLDFEKDWKKSQSMPFRLINNLVIIPVIINNSDTLNFILDTGISAAMITDLTGEDSIILNFAREIELQGLGTGETVKGLHSYGNEIRIRKIKGQNQDIYVILNNAFQLSARMGIPIHGILGYPVFRDFVIIINYDSKTIQFHRPESFRIQKKKYGKYTCIPLEIENSKPFIYTEITDNKGNQHRVKLLLDTGASHAIWLDGGSVPGLPLPPGSKETYLGTGLSGEVFGYLGRLKGMEIAGNSLSNVIVSFPDSASIGRAAGLNNRNGTAGSEVLKRFNLIIDYSRQQICLKPNSTFSSEFLQNLSGMEVIAPYPGLKVFVVDGVRQGSPAEKAGIRKDDLIRVIDGLKAEKIELNDIYQILQRNPGKKINIKILRGFEQIETSLILENFI